LAKLFHWRIYPTYIKNKSYTAV